VYDSYGHDGLKSGGYSPGWDFVDGFPDLTDLFSSFFGGGAGGGRRRSGPQAGDHIRLDLELDFKDAAFGTKKEISIHRLEHCDHCHGSGAEPGSGPTTCPSCQGAGQLRQTTQTIIGHFTQIAPCGRCGGTGSIVVNPCQQCHGKGRAEKEKTLTITIPAGVDDGTRLRVSQEGDAGPQGGPPGDLYVVIQVSPHPEFQRDGYNVHSVLKISYPELVLGAELDVNVLRGTEKLKIPAGTPSGHVFTLKNAGVPVVNANNRSGDHFVHVEVEIPKHLAAEERKLIERLKELVQEQRDPHDTKNSASFIDKVKDVLTGHH
jgi:molecular chaperone DnaJ